MFWYLTDILYLDFEVDAEKKRKLTRKELERLIKAIGYVFKGREIEDVDKIMNVIWARAHDKGGVA